MSAKSFNYKGANISWWVHRNKNKNFQKITGVQARQELRGVEQHLQLHQQDPESCRGHRLLWLLQTIHPWSHERDSQDRWLGKGSRWDPRPGSASWHDPRQDGNPGTPWDPCWSQVLFYATGMTVNRPIYINASSWIPVHTGRDRGDCLVTAVNLDWLLGQSEFKITSADQEPRSSGNTEDSQTHLAIATILIAFRKAILLYI